MNRFNRFLIRHLGRRTSGGAWMAEIDGLRFIAIGLVFAHHLRAYSLEFLPQTAEILANGTLLGSIGHRGYVGVELFFAISGFILGRPFLLASIGKRPPVPIRPYFLRRLTRLEPPYLLNLALIALLLVLVKGMQPWALAPHLAASSVYLHNQVYGAGSAVNFVAWSLEIEVQFYCLMPVLALLFRLPTPYRFATYALLALVSAGISQGFLTARVTLSIIDKLPHFLAGIAVADVFVAGDWELKPASVRADIISALAFLLIIPVLQWNPHSVRWLVPPLIGIAYAGLLRGVYLRKVVAFPFIAITGGMCYTIYLYHGFAISAVGRVVTPFLQGVSPSMSLAALFLVSSVAVVSFAGGLFAFVERPCMNPSWPTDLLRWLRRRS